MDKFPQCGRHCPHLRYKCGSRLHGGSGRAHAYADAMSAGIWAASSRASLTRSCCLSGGGVVPALPARAMQDWQEVAALCERGELARAVDALRALSRQQQQLADWSRRSKAT